MRTIAVVNQKGGCGKTTVAINLASALTEFGRRVLLVDMDPQSHCAVGLAVPEEQIEQGIYDVLISMGRNEPIRLAEILWQISERLELAPASIDLSAFEQQMSGVNESQLCLSNVLSNISKDYDYAIIDCPPAVGLLTFSAMTAATDIIVPVETGYFALHGLSKQLETINMLSQRGGRTLDVRILASMYDIRTKMAREVMAELRRHFADKMFSTTVNFNTKIKEAASFGQPIGEYDPASKGQADFRALAEEIIGAEAGQQRRELVDSLSEQLESISSTADELMETAKIPIENVQTAKTEKEQPLDTDAKLCDYYGVNQLSDGIVFVTLYPRAETVQIAGDFNNWQPQNTVMDKVGTSGVWQTKMNIPAGRYRYRLVVDGQWQQDPYNESTEANPFGEFNSVLVVN